MSEKQTASPVAALSPELLAVISSAVAAAVSAANAKPELTEFEKMKQADEQETLQAKILARQQDAVLRKQQGEQELKIQADRRAVQKRCRHMQPNGASAIAEVPPVQAIICLHCQAMIKAAPGPWDDADRYIYDENLFYQLLSSRFTTTL